MSAFLTEKCAINSKNEREIGPREMPLKYWFEGGSGYGSTGVRKRDVLYAVKGGKTLKGITQQRLERGKGNGGGGNKFRL